jgi:hypothetical protein
MFRRITLAMLARIGGVARDQLVEVAALAIRSFVLVHERELVAVERIEPFVPGNLLQ